MSKNKKLSRVRLLMVISQVLITGFVIYWLVGRFDAEKEELSKELDREFQLSENKMLDSLLMLKLQPILDISNENSSDTLEDIIIPSSTIENKIVTLNAKDVSLKSLVDSSPVSIHIHTVPNDSLHQELYIASGNEPGNIDVRNATPDKDDIMFRSFKLYVERTQDSDSTKTITYASSDSLDSEILIMDFRSKLDKYDLIPIWVRDMDDSSRNEESLFYYESLFSNVALGVEVEGGGIYAIKKIAPNIVFGLVLLVMTGLSFIISFISLKKQFVLNDLRSGFVSNISHELNTPVSTVKVALEALEKYDLQSDPAKAHDYIFMAKKEIDRLDNLIQKVLVSTSFGENNGMMELENIHFEALLREVIQSMQLRFEEKGASVNIIMECEHLIVKGDLVHLQGVIVNLLDNSLKYSAGKPEIEIKVTKIDKAVICSVSDNGIGIPSEYHSKVFDRFFRVPTGDKHNVKGYGLGLNYVAMVMDRLHGSVKVRNNPNQGCTVTLTFVES